jgi:hypothetical protein
VHLPFTILSARSGFGRGTEDLLAEVLAVAGRQRLARKQPEGAPAVGLPLGAEEERRPGAYRR